MSRQEALARNTDPITSHLAAEEVIATGAMESQKAEVLEWLRTHAGEHTSREISTRAGLDRYMVARRLPDLEKCGLVRRGEARDCYVSERLSVTWAAVSEPRQIAMFEGGEDYPE